MQQKQYSEYFFSKFGDYFQMKNGKYYNNIPLFIFISHIFGKIIHPKREPMLGSSH
jgi:hypothetical protein